MKLPCSLLINIENKYCIKTQIVKLKSCWRTVYNTSSLYVPSNHLLKSYLPSLKHFSIFYQTESDNDQIRHVSKINTFWTILKNQPVLKDICNTNKQSKAASISSFYFSFLYTNISHKKLYECCVNLFVFISKERKGIKYVTVNRYSAKWATHYKVIFSYIYKGNPQTKSKVSVKRQPLINCKVPIKQLLL